MTTMDLELRSNALHHPFELIPKIYQNEVHLALARMVSHDDYGRS